MAAVDARADLLLVRVDPMTTPLVPDGVMLRGRWLPAHELAIANGRP